MKTHFAQNANMITAGRVEDQTGYRFNDEIGTSVTVLGRWGSSDTIIRGGGSITARSDINTIIYR